MALTHREPKEGEGGYVCSTLANDVRFTNFEPVKKGAKDSGPSIPVERVLIKGGAGVIDKKSGTTAVAVVTEVSGEELEVLRKNVHFTRAIENGFIRVVADKDDAEKIATATGMTLRDKSAQTVPADYPEDKQPVSNKD